MCLLLPSLHEERGQLQILCLTRANSLVKGVILYKKKVRNPIKGKDRTSDAEYAAASFEPNGSRLYISTNVQQMPYFQRLVCR